MSKTLKYFFLLISFAIIGSCTSEDKNKATYFGGKIINPKTDYVLLFEQGELIDSLFLDKNDKFIGEYKDFNEGLYTFKHGDELQYVYLEPKDSILIRLNTWDFDETLVFSGSGADKNNILIDWFLEGEKESKNSALNKMFKLEPELFKFKMDSVLNIRAQKIKAFKEKNEDLPSNYLEVLDVLVNYPIYIRFEEYPNYYRYYQGSEHFPIVSNDFYSFRKKIDINNNNLKHLGPFNSYISYRLHNNVYSEGIPRSSSKFTSAILNSIDKSLTNEDLKNRFLYEILVGDFLKKSSCSLKKDDFYTYFKLSTDIENKKQVQRIINDIKNMHGGKMLSDFKITDYLNTKRSIQKLAKNKNTAICFWNPSYTNTHSLIKRFNNLTKKFPKVNFILVKLTDIDTDYVHGIDIKNQYYLEPTSEANSFLTSKLPRTLLVNKKGIIVNGYAHIKSYRFNKQIKNLQKN